MWQPRQCRPASSHCRCERTLDIRPRKGEPEPPKQSVPYDMSTPDGYDFYLKLGPLAELNQKLFHNEATYWQEIVDHPNYDAVCFHPQHCAEKNLKSFLQEADITFRRTHDLCDLLNSALSVEPAWTLMTADLNALSAFAVEYRYPGESADLDEAREALEKCQKVRQIIRGAMHLDKPDSSPGDGE